MMTRHFTLLLPLVSAFSLHAQTSWTLDRNHSSVIFTVTHMVVSEVSGSFNDFSVTLDSRDEDFADAKVEATIQVASIDTDNEKRDAHLRSGDFFSADSFPTIQFVSSKFEKTGDDTFRIRGTLTVRGISKEVVFDAVHNGMVQTRNGTVSGWTANLSLNRFDYGLKWNAALETGSLIVGETVGIRINAEFRKTQS